MQTLLVPCPLFHRCAKSRLFVHRGAHRVVEGSFFTLLCARTEDSMGFSWGLGLELFSAE